MIIKIENKTKALIAAKFDIRRSIGQFNEDKGINDKTVKIAMLSAEKEALEQYEQYKAQARTSYGTGSTVYAEGLDSAKIDKIRAQIRDLKRQIDNIKDSCAGINANSSIQLADETLATLKLYSLI
mgnify:CR=1 FL=1